METLLLTVLHNLHKLKTIKECSKRPFSNILVLVVVKEWDLVVLELEEEQEVQDIQLHSCQEHHRQVLTRNHFQVAAQQEWIFPEEVEDLVAALATIILNQQYRSNLPMAHLEIPSADNHPNLITVEDPNQRFCNQVVVAVVQRRWI